MTDKVLWTYDQD